MITKHQECFPGTHGNSNAMVLQSQQKIKLKPTNKHTFWTSETDSLLVKTPHCVG